MIRQPMVTSIMTYYQKLYTYLPYQECVLIWKEEANHGK